MSINQNITITALDKIRGLLLNKVNENMLADEIVKKTNLKALDYSTDVRYLSGGNQQKVVVGKWIFRDAEIVIFDEPTRGIDVGTKVEIQKLVLKLAEEGVSVTFISSEIEEMLRTCSRLIVMRDRKIVGELMQDDMTQAKIMHTIAGEAAQYE